MGARFSRIVNITSAMVPTRTRSGRSSGARTGTMAVMKGLQRQTVPDNVMINQLFPERIDSGRQLRWRVSRPNARGHGRGGAAPQAATSQRGGWKPKEFGVACAFLSSAQA